MLCKMYLGQAELLMSHGEESPGTLDVGINLQSSGPAFHQTDEYYAFRTHSMHQLQGTKFETLSSQHHCSTGK